MVVLSEWPCVPVAVSEGVGGGRRGMRIEWMLEGRWGSFCCDFPSVPHHLLYNSFFLQRWQGTVFPQPPLPLAIRRRRVEDCVHLNSVLWGVWVSEWVRKSLLFSERLKEGRKQGALVPFLLGVLRFPGICLFETHKGSLFEYANGWVLHVWKQEIHPMKCFKLLPVSKSPIICFVFLRS